jgi:hypothetical protein
MKFNFSLWRGPAVAAASVIIFACVVRMLDTEKEILTLAEFEGSGKVTVTLPVRYSIIGKPEYGIDPEKTICHMAVNPIDNKGYEEAALTRLYGFLLEKGKFKTAVESAVSFGYTKEFAEKIHAKTVQKIKDSPYKEVIEKLNDMDVDKM